MLKFFIFGLVSAVIAKEDDLYCKDPDTYKYYAVNATWGSTTFCGNNTCRIRYKNATITEHSPDPTVATVKPTTTKHLYEDITEDNSESDDSKEDCPECKDVNTGDRYLNRNEVNSLAKFLYSVKKSELDNLIEFYNMVTNLNSEMVSAATEIKHSTTTNTPDSHYYQSQQQTSAPTYSVAEHDASEQRMHNFDNLYKIYSKENINPANIYSQSEKFLENYRISDLLSSSPNDEMTRSRKDMLTAAPWFDSRRPFFYQNSPNSNEQPKMPKLYQISRAPNGYPILLNPESNVYPKILVAMPTSKLKSINSKQLKHYGYPERENSYYYSPLHNSEDTRQNYYTTKDDYKTVQTTSWKTPSISETDLNKVRAFMQPSKSNANSFGIFATVKKRKSDNIDRMIPIFETRRLERSISEIIVNNNITTETPVIKNELNETKTTPEATTELASTTQITSKEVEVEADKSFETEKERIIQQIQALENDLRNLEMTMEKKKEENETMETYIETERCSLESEPGFFRAGDLDKPFPLCCPQRIV